MTKTIPLDVYLDESGDFTEAGQRGSSAPPRQLVALVAPRGALSGAGARKVIEDANAAAGAPLGAQIARSPEHAGGNQCGAHLNTERSATSTTPPSRPGSRGSSERTETP